MIKFIDVTYIIFELRLTNLALVSTEIDLTTITLRPTVGTVANAIVFTDISIEAVIVFSFAHSDRINKMRSSHALRNRPVDKVLDASSEM